MGEVHVHVLDIVDGADFEYFSYKSCHGGRFLKE